MRKAAFHTLGCKVNAYETEAMTELLKKDGYEIVPFTEAADVYVINTCAVTNIAERKSRQMLHRAKKLNPGAVIVAAGCYVQVGEKELKEDPAVDLVLGTGQKHLIARVLAGYFSQEQKEQPDEALNRAIAEEYEELEVAGTTDRTRAFVKVQDGCNQFCSYCIIPFARGRVRSRSMESVQRELNRLAGSGIREVVLTGIHLSSYGRDFGGSPGLIDLVEMAGRVPGIERIRLGSLEPGIITEEFAGRLSAVKGLCPHFHLSLQSGCAATLKRMNRHYTPEEYREKCDLLRRVFDRPALTTDVIVGFPGETEEEFAETEAFLKEIAFYEMHVFKYSRRKGTRADLMENQVPEETKNVRSARLLELTRQQSRAYRESLIGMEEEILLEEESILHGQRVMSGLGKRYVRCAIPADGAAAGGSGANDLICGRIGTFASEDVMWLETVKEKG